MDRTTIGISKEMWKYLNGVKECGESFEDVLRRILNLEPVKDKRTGDA